MAHRPTIRSDAADYLPGSTVVLIGTNWQGDASVTVVVVPAEGPSWKHSADLPVQPDGTVSNRFTLPDWYVPVYSVTATGRDSGRIASTTFTDSRGTYSLHWYAADPAVNIAPYLPTYQKLPPSSLPCPTPSGGTGRASDPLADAVAYGPTFVPSDLDAVPSLEPKDMALGQIVPYELEVAVSGTTAPENGTIEFTADWLAKTTSGKDFGYDPTYGLYCAFVDQGDLGTRELGTQTNGLAKVDTFSFVRLGQGTSNDRTRGTVKVSGLDDGDNVIVELWVVLKDSIPADANGNVQTTLVSAQTCTDS